MLPRDRTHRQKKGLETATVEYQNKPKNRRHHLQSPPTIIIISPIKPNDDDEGNSKSKSKQWKQARPISGSYK